MMLITGKAIVEGAGIKGFHVYIHGKSDTGKSTIIETFYK
jgi:guanylate kinase